MNLRFFKRVLSVDSRKIPCTIHNLEDNSGQEKNLPREAPMMAKGLFYTPRKLWKIDPAQRADAEIDFETHALRGK